MTAERRSGSSESLSAQGSADHFAAIVQFSGDAILTKDPEGTITSWNPAAERMYGYPADEAIGRPISILIPENRAGEERRILARVLRGERVSSYETERVTRDGRTLAVSLTVSPVRDATGRVTAASVIARDVTRRRRSERLASRLQEATAALSREVAAERVLEVILEQVVPAVDADAGTIGLVDGEEVVLAGAAGYADASLDAWRRFPLEAEVPMTVAIRSGEAVWAVSRTELFDRFPELTGTPIDFDALAVLPLASGPEPFGAVALSFDRARGFDPEERAFLVATTRQAAFALERARRFEAERLVAERQRLLAEAGELFSQSLDPDAILTRLAALAIRHVADWCGIELVEEDGGLRSVAVAHVDPERVALAGRLRERYPIDPDEPSGAANVIRTGNSELYPEITPEAVAESARDDEHRRLLAELEIRSAMVVPLRARGRVFGAITLVGSRPDRSYDGDDLELAEDLARRASLAVDNARLFRREHEAALLLQRSLLPQSLPVIAGLALDARYEPAGAEFEVGGDWYEVLALEDGTVALTIGDVAGRGIRAASVMGRIRPALRAYVLEGHGPGEALRMLDRMMREFDRPEMTTVFHLHYDPASGRATYVRAGHLPALYRGPGGEISELVGAGTPPLGVIDEIEVREHEVELPGGGLLLLYTDGLIERRDRDLGVCLEALENAFAAAPAGAAECLDWLYERFGAEANEDDVAMVAVST